MVRTRQKTGSIAALDVGSTKIACFIAQLDDDGVLHVQGVSHHQSHGMRNGQVADMIALENSVRTAVDAAEHMAGRRTGGILLSVSGVSLDCRNIDAEIPISGHAVRDADIRRLLDQGRRIPILEGSDREIIHCLPTGYAIDDNGGITDPRGMFGERLGMSIHAISVGAGSLRNLTAVIDRCHLNVDAVIAAPYASALACTVDDEKDMGVTVLDMGGGTTSISVFVDGHPAYVGVVPIGGNHITADVAKGLSTPFAQAERLKTMFGSVLPSPADSRELLRVPLVGEDGDAPELPRSELTRIICPRIEEIFELVLDRLEEAGMLHSAGRRIVLTGGASQIQGIREKAEQILKKQVRLGRPKRLKGLPESVGGPAFSCCSGLLRYAVQDGAAHPVWPNSLENEPKEHQGRLGKLARLGAWFKENF